MQQRILHTILSVDGKLDARIYLTISLIIYTYEHRIIIIHLKLMEHPTNTHWLRLSTYMHTYIHINNQHYNVE